MLLASIVNPTPPLYHVRGFHEPFSAASHLLGAAVFLVLGLRLLRNAGGSRARRAALGVYVSSCVCLFLMSGTYHATVTGGAANRLLVRLDHAAIFLLIAGTFTPIHGLMFRGLMRWGALLVVWAAAVAGIVLKVAFIGAVVPWVSLTLYLAMGWFGTAAGVALWRRHGFAFVRPLLLGGIAYSAGAVMEFLRWPVIVPGVVHAHDVFHVAVLAGAGWHFAFVSRIVVDEEDRTAGQLLTKTVAQDSAPPPTEPAHSADADPAARYDRGRHADAR